MHLRYLAYFFAKYLRVWLRFECKSVVFDEGIVVDMAVADCFASDIIAENNLNNFYFSCLFCCASHIYYRSRQRNA